MLYKKGDIIIVNQWVNSDILGSSRPMSWQPNMQIFASILFSHSVMSNSLQPQGLQHARLPCPSPTPRACSNSCPLSWWCHPTISSCRPLLLLPSTFPSIRVFSNKLALHIRWPKYWSFSFSISPPMNIQGLFPLGMSGWISLLSKGLSRVFSSTTIQKHQFFGTQSSLLSNSHIHTWLWKNHSFDSMDFCQAKWHL